MHVLALALQISLIAGLISIIYVALITISILRCRVRMDRATEIHGYIREAAIAYMKAQYSVILSIAILIGLTITGLGHVWNNNLLINIGLAYLVGSFSSAIVSLLGMYLAILTNIRVLNTLAEEKIKKALIVAFRGGSITGFLVSGVGILGIAVLFMVFKGITHSLTEATQSLLGYAFGASTVALFARVGGGMYTKAADVGADLVGKVEVGIPEDDPRNPGVIADNVGDNVGDCAGMGADLFESYVESIVASMVIAAMMGEEALIAYPLLFSGVALFVTLLTSQFVSLSPFKDPGRTLTALSILSLVSVALVTFIAVRLTMSNLVCAWIATVLGLIAGGIVGFTSDYFTSPLYRPVKIVASYSRAGPALTILSGLSMGFYSTFIPTLTVALAAVGAFMIGSNLVTSGCTLLGGIYAIALAGVGMLSMTSIVVSADAYGPIVDNTAGLAEQAGYPDSVRDLADKLDSAGNTMKSISKGYAIGSAALTALALLFSYVSVLAHNLGVSPDKLMNTIFNVGNPIHGPYLISGIVIGVALPALFTAIVVQSVTAAAFRLVEEIRRQFREKPGILEWKEKPDYARAVQIVTYYALRRLILPGALALLAPLVIGIALGPAALGGTLLGAVAGGLLLGLFQGNVGNTWDNAKKYVEMGHFGGKGSEAHKAAVIGDTVGDPLKDAAGPSINILIKLMAIASTVYVPIIVHLRPI